MQHSARHSPGSEAWRKAVAPLVKGANHDASGAQIAALQAAISALQALSTSDVVATVPDAEVAASLALLAQCVQAVHAAHDMPDSGHAAAAPLCTALCQLVQCVMQQSKLAAAPAAPLAVLCGILAGWVQGHTSAGVAAPRQLQLDALAALVAVLPQHYAQVPPCQRELALGALLAALRQARGAQDGGNTSPGSGSSRGNAADAQRLAAHALAALCARAPGGAGAADAQAAVALNASELPLVQQALIQALCTAARRPRDDVAHGRCYAALLRALAAAVAADTEAVSWAAQAGALVEALQRLITYGWQQQRQESPWRAGPAAAIAPAASPPASPLPAPPAPAPPPAPLPSAAAQPAPAYVPPHLRGRQRPAPRGDASDSDVSDCEAGGCGVRAPERAPSARVRLALLSCMQAMAQACPRALHPHWSSILPMQQPLQQRPLSPHLVTLLLHDPVPRVRAMAAVAIAALVDGAPARQHLAVAEAKSRQRPAMRGFTTLSASLGYIATSLHTGLLHAVRGEPCATVLAAVLRTLGVVCAALPYERLPADLLPELLDAVWRRLRALLAALRHAPDGADAGGDPDAAMAAVAAALACIAQALATRAPSASLEGQLSAEAAAAAAIGVEPPGSAQRLSAAAQFSEWGRRAPGAAAVLDQQSSAAAPPGRCSAGGASDAGSQPASEGRPAAGASCLAAELAEFAITPLLPPAARASALSALRGLCNLYPLWAPPGAWPRICAAMDFSVRPLSREGHPPGGVAGGCADGASLAAGSTDDRAAQQAVLLLPEWLNAIQAQAGHVSQQQDQEQEEQQQQQLGRVRSLHLRGAPWPAWSPAQLQGAWQQALQLLAAPAQHHASHAVRAAAAAALGEASRQALIALLPSGLQQMLSTLGAVAGTDAVAAVRVAACKSLGAIALALPTAWWAQAAASDARLLLEPVAAGAEDGVAAVRVAASWALANACDALRIASSAPARCPAADAVVSDAGSGTGCGATALPAPQLRQLCQLALLTSEDADKVRANGVRALGNLLAAWRPEWWGARPEGGVAGEVGGGGDASRDASLAWVADAVAALQSGLTTGSVKVQWNACYAAAGLFANSSIFGAASADGAAAVALRVRAEALLLVLVVLLRDSPNLKLRTHAAAALSAPAARAVYASVYGDALLVVATAMEGMHSGSSEDADAAAGPNEAPALAGAAEGGGGFADQRYATGLRQQLAGTLLHLLSLAAAPESVRVRDALSRRLGVLVAELRLVAAASAAVAVATALDGVTSDEAATTTALQLPDNPFHSQGPTLRQGAQPAQAAHQRSGSTSRAPSEEQLILQLQELAARGVHSQAGTAAAGLLCLLERR